VEEVNGAAVLSNKYLGFGVLQLREWEEPRATLFRKAFSICSFAFHLAVSFPVI